MNSWHLMDLIFQSRLPSPAVKLVLLNFAHRASRDTGEAWPSKKRIGFDAGVRKTATTAALKYLRGEEVAGWEQLDDPVLLVRAALPGQSKRYVIDTAALARLVDSQAGQRSARSERPSSEGDAERRGGVRSAHGRGPLSEPRTGKRTGEEQQQQCASARSKSPDHPAAAPVQARDGAGPARAAAQDKAPSEPQAVVWPEEEAEARSLGWDDSIPASVYAQSKGCSREQFRDYLVRAGRAGNPAGWLRAAIDRGYEPSVAAKAKDEAARNQERSAMAEKLWYQLSDADQRRILAQVRHKFVNLQPRVDRLLGREVLSVSELRAEGVWGAVCRLLLASVAGGTGPDEARTSTELPDVA